MSPEFWPLPLVSDGDNRNLGLQPIDERVWIPRRQYVVTTTVVALGPALRGLDDGLDGRL